MDFRIEFWIGQVFGMDFKTCFLRCKNELFEGFEQKNGG